MNCSLCNDSGFAPGIVEGDMLVSEPGPCPECDADWPRNDPDELVLRLRAVTHTNAPVDTCHLAADMIERQAAELAELKAEIAGGAHDSASYK